MNSTHERNEKTTAEGLDATLTGCLHGATHQPWAKENTLPQDDPNADESQEGRSIWMCESQRVASGVRCLERQPKRADTQFHPDFQMNPDESRWNPDESRWIQILVRKWWGGSIQMNPDESRWILWIQMNPDKIHNCSFRSFKQVNFEFEKKSKKEREQKGGEANWHIFSQCAFKFKLSKKVETYITPGSKAIGLLRKHRSCAPLVKILDLLFKKGVMRWQQLAIQAPSSISLFGKGCSSRCVLWGIRCANSWHSRNNNRLHEHLIHNSLTIY